VTGRRARWRSTVGPSARLYAAELLVVAAAFFATARFGFDTAFVYENVGPFWPATGVSIAALFLRGYRLWPGVLAGSLLANLDAGAAALPSVGAAAGAVAEALVAVHLLRLADFRAQFDRLRDVIAFVPLACVVAPTLSATLGVTALWLNGDIPGAAYDRAWTIWWFGNASGALMLAPALLVWATRARLPTRAAVIEGAAWLLAVAVVTEVIFSERFGVRIPPYPVFALAILISLRFRQAGIAMATLVIAAIAAWRTADGSGPFSTGATAHDIAVLDGYLLTVAITGLVIAALLSERTRTERLLEEREERFRLLIENASDLVLVIDRDGAVTYASPASEQMLGLRPAELVGTQLHSGVHEADRPALAAAFARAVDLAGTSVPVDLRYRHQDGSHRSLSSVLISRLDDARIGGVIATLHDVTERERWEGQLRQAQRMDAVGRLAGGITHDFNNLLTAVMGYSDLILQTLPADDPLRADVEEIKRAGERGSLLTRQLLAFSRGQPVERVAVDVNEVVSDLEPLLTRLIREDIRLEIALRADDARVLGDKGQLEQVLVNLVVNASDAMPDGGTLAITTESVELDAEYFSLHGIAEGSPGRHLQLEVTDSGHGMDEETRSHVFEPFYSTKEEGQGTGLGLATVYGIVRQSGGFVWVYSEAHIGTTFKVYLPSVEVAVADEGDERVPEREQELRSALQGGTALLVEDDAMVRALVRIMLEELGLEIVEAEDGDKALALSEASDPDGIHVLVTDTVLPGVGGIELAQRVRARHPGLVTLVMSGYSETRAMGAAPPAQGTGFIPKPFGPADFFAKLEALLATAGTDHAGERSP
jgi:PAS domain S-box-containing protein